MSVVCGFPKGIVKDGDMYGNWICWSLRRVVYDTEIFTEEEIFSKVETLVYSEKE